MNIPAVPESMTRQQVSDFLAALGVDANDVPAGAVLHLGPKSISIQVFARNAEGRRYISPDGKHAAMHDIDIPIVFEENE